ncbi:MAG: iron ABC transporter permease [Schleiferiaceae bacterium]|nr:iron ABC transporter permease [Schleiferiaceae bacterium]
MTASKKTTISLFLLVLVLFISSLKYGAVKLSLSTLFVGEASALQEYVFWQLRLPRSLAGIGVGCLLAVCGAALQGLFRNPLVEPGLIGVTTGASAAAVLVISFGSWLSLSAILGGLLLPLAAFMGALLVSFFIYKLSQSAGKSQIALLILAGVAVNAIFGALTGFVLNYSSDAALRSFTFWAMGDLSGANWLQVAIILPLAIAILTYLSRNAADLDALSLGEQAAFHLGVDVQRISIHIILLTALGIGAAVAFFGAIGFVGLVVPHMVRKIYGARNAVIIPISALLGAGLLMAADLVARLIILPAELPIGIVTSLIGGPFFLWLLIQNKKKLA